MNSENIEYFEIFPWDKNFETGIVEVDEQHKQLVYILNQLAAHLANRSHPDTLNKYFDELANYADYHFKTEETIWNKYLSGDEWFISHEKTHESFISDVIALRQEEEKKPLDDVLQDVVSFLSKWLAYHILDSDKRMAKVVQSVESGMTLADAKNKANEEMSGSMKILIDTVLNMYEKLTSRTMGIMREKTLRRKAEIALLKAKEEADFANLSKSMFLASMSHEIRNPMNAIIGMTDLALKTGLNEEQKNYISKAHLSATNLLHIINDILDFSKIEAGKLDMEETDFMLDDVLSNMKTIVSTAAEKNSVHISVNVPSEVPRKLRGDPLRLGQVLTNLLGNAVKFSHQNSTVSLSVESKKQTSCDTQLLFTVTDNGIGMSEEQQKKLFKDYSQADSSTTREYGGTGLGLVISKKIVELMNGQIWLESEQGKGSSFYFSVTFAKAQSHIEANVAGENDIQNAIDQLRGAKILVVEDNEINQELAEILLSDNGLSVEVAANGQQAVDLITSEHFDGVLMDCLMPVMDGYEATQRIRSNNEFKNLPIIAMTGSAMKQDIEKALSVGMNDHISKPVDPAIVFQTMAKWIKPV